METQELEKLKRVVPAVVNMLTAPGHPQSRCNWIAELLIREGFMKEPTETRTSIFSKKDGVDAGTYVVSEPLTVEAVRARIVALPRPSCTPLWLAEMINIYRDVLGVVAATDRHGPLGALARAALTAEEE